MSGALPNKPLKLPAELRPPIVPRGDPASPGWGVHGRLYAGRSLAAMRWAALGACGQLEMHESPEDLLELQSILDESYGCAGEHIRSIFRPERRLSADQVVRALQGVFVLHLATTTASGAPFLAPIDGLFFRGRFWFGVPPGAVRISHLRARPRVSAVHSIGEELCIIVHGVVHEVDTNDPIHGPYLDYTREVYGAAWDYGVKHYRDRKGTPFTGWIEPRRMYAMATNPRFLT